MRTKSLTQASVTKQLILQRLLMECQNPRLRHGHGRHKIYRIRVSFLRSHYDRRRKLSCGTEEASILQPFAPNRARHPHLLRYTRSANIKHNIPSSDQRVWHKRCASIPLVPSFSSLPGNESGSTTYRRRSWKKSFNLVLVGSAISLYIPWGQPPGLILRQASSLA